MASTYLLSQVETEGTEEADPGVGGAGQRNQRGDGNAQNIAEPSVGVAAHDLPIVAQDEKKDQGGGH
jgi:hypothetical protein